MWRAGQDRRHDADDALAAFVHADRLSSSLYLRHVTVLGLPQSRSLERLNAYTHYAELFLLPLLATVGAGCILAFVFDGLHWSLKTHLKVTLPLLLATFLIAWLLVSRSSTESRMVVAGTIVDQANNNPIGQATVSLLDGSVRYVSEDNGNFVLDLTGKLKDSERARVRVTKEGYQPYDGTVVVPTQGFVVPLHHL